MGISNCQTEESRLQRIISHLALQSRYFRNLTLLLVGLSRLLGYQQD